MDRRGQIEGSLCERRDDTIVVPAGTKLFRQGDPGDCAYVVEQGRVAITLEGNAADAALARPGLPDQVRPDQVRADRLRQGRAVAFRGPGEFFGEMAIIDGSARSASATVVEDARLLVVTSDRLSRRLSEADPVVRLVLDVLVERLRATMDLFGPDEDRPGPGRSEPQPSDGGTGNRKGLADIRLEGDLAKALAEDRLDLHYQPIVDLKRYRVVGFEALARWTHPTHGALSPQVFIPLAEASGLISTFTRWLLPRVLDEGAALAEGMTDGRTDGGEDRLFVAANLSIIDLQDPTLPEFLAQILADRVPKPVRLKIEVTESLALSSPDLVREGLQRCQALGVEVAIDDFGTGYSSLAQLHSLPIGALKIDRSFVQALDTSESGRKIVQTIIRLADDLDIPTIAEGAETAEQVDILQAMGCRQVQGYFFARPMPPDEARAWLRDWAQERVDGAGLARPLDPAGDPDAKIARRRKTGA